MASPPVHPAPLALACASPCVCGPTRQYIRQSRYPVVSTASISYVLRVVRTHPHLTNALTSPLPFSARTEVSTATPLPTSIGSSASSFSVKPDRFPRLNASYFLALALSISLLCSSLGPPSSSKTRRFASFRASAASRFTSPGEGRLNGSLS